VLAAIVPLALAGWWIPPSGDEPHYLIVAHSLLSDGDLDLADDYGGREYAPFHRAALSPHYKPGFQAGSRYSLHGVGLPILLLPAYALGSWIGPGAAVALPRALLALLYGLFAWLLYGLVEDLAGGRAARAGTTAATILAPLLFAPLFLFPEVPAMLLGLLALIATGARHGGVATSAGDRPEAPATRRGDRPGTAAPSPSGRPRGAAAGAPPWLGSLAVAVLPWLGVKYIPMAMALVFAAVLRAAPGRRWRATAGLGAPLAATLLLHSAYTWLLYRSLSPASIYLGAGPADGAPALGGDWLAYLAAWPGALATAVGYLMDQKEGLLAYGPHYLLAAAGLGWLWRRDRRTLAALGIVAAAHVAPYALSQQLGGQGPPVRPLMAVLWTLVPALGIGLTIDVPYPREARARPGQVHNSSPTIATSRCRAVAALRGGLLALTAVLTALYAGQPWLLPHDYPVEASRLLQSYSPYGSGWWRLFPQWVNVDAPNPGVTAIWTLAIAGIAVLLWRRGSAAVGPLRDGGDGRAWGWGAAAVTLAAAAAYLSVFHATVVRTDRHHPTALAAGPVAWVAAELPEVAWAESGGVWVSPGRPVDLVLTGERPLEFIDVRLRVLVPTEVLLRGHGAEEGGRVVPGADRLARLQLGPGIPDGGGYAYRFRVRAGDGAAPADLEGDADERQLGVFFQIIGLGER
jgi:hypothetical protein